MMPFDVISKEEHTDSGYGSNYSSKHKITTTYQHPKGVDFKHVHVDGRDYEDRYVQETVLIGDITIYYSYDWGNYFIWEYVKLSKNDEEVGYAQQEYGAVDPLKTETRQKEQGQEILAQLGADFGMELEDFMSQVSKTFGIKLEVLKLFV